MTYDYLIVGAGFSGSVAAERLTAAGKNVLVIDRRAQVGGNAADVRDGDYHSPLYGPHLFHTSSDKVFRYLSQFTTWRFYEHRVLADYAGLRFPVPFNLKSLDETYTEKTVEKWNDEVPFFVQASSLRKSLLEYFGEGHFISIKGLLRSDDACFRLLALHVNEKVFRHYSNKQWGPWADKLDQSVQARVPIRLSYDDRYFTDKYQFMPADGYSQLFCNMLRHVDVKLGANFVESYCREDFKHIIWTGPIDEYFHYKHGHLPYRSLQFFPATFKEDFKKPANVGTINYTGPESVFTRCSFLAAMNGVTTKSLEKGIAELPCEYEPGKNEPYYPVLCEESKEMLLKYEEEVKLLKNKVTFLGRLADYKYYNMDQAVARALMVSEKLLGIKS